MAHTDGMSELFVYALFFGTLFFLFPVFVRLDAYADVAENKCFFSLRLFAFLKIFGGYLQFKKEGIVFHITKKKAVILPFQKIAPMRKKFEITKGFQLYRFHQIVESGGEGKPYGLLFAAALQAAAGQIFSVARTLHPFLSLKNGVLLTEDAALKITLQATAVFNGLIVFLAAAKKILEAILLWIRKKRSTA